MMPQFDGSTYDFQSDSIRLSSQLEKVKNLMLRGSWLTLSEISRLINGSEASISARLRDLRKERFGGFEIERRRRGDPSKGLFEYRLLVPTPKPQMSFDQTGQGMLLDFSGGR